MPTKFARATGGSVNADATWSLSSGGPADTTKPTAADDIRLDAASGNIVVDAALFGRSLDCNGYTGNFSGNFNVSLGDGTAGAGNIALRLSATMTYSHLGNISFVSFNGTQQTVTMAGRPVVSFFFAGNGASYLLADNFTASGTLSHTAGTLNLNGKTVQAGVLVLNSSIARVLTFGAAAVTLTAGTAIDVLTPTNLTVSANTAVITCTAGAALVFGSAVNWNGASLVFTGNSVPQLHAGGTWLNITRVGTAVKSDGMSFAPTTITGTLTLQGNSAVNRLHVASNAGLGVARIVSAAVVVLSNCDFMDVAATGAAAPWTGTSMGNAGGNSGITFDTPVTQYWGGVGSHLTGSAYRLADVNGNFAFAPDSTPLRVTGDITLDAKIAADDWTPTSEQMIVGKFNSSTGKRSYTLSISGGSTGRLGMRTTSQDQATGGIITSSVGTGVADGATKWVRATMRLSDKRVQFFLSDDGVAWTQLGTDQTTALVGSIGVFDEPLTIGSSTNGVSPNFGGSIFRVRIYSDITQTTKVFDADFSTAPANARSFVESSTNATVVTLNAAGGNWSDVTKWSTRVPLPQDNVICNKAAVGTGQLVVTADMLRLGADIDFTGYTGTWQPSLNVIGYGSLILGIAMTVVSSVTISLLGRGSHNILSNGKTLGTGTLVIQNPGGTYTILDALTLGGGAGQLNASFGTLASSGVTITASIFNLLTAGDGTKPILNLGTSTLVSTVTTAVTAFSIRTTSNTSGLTLAFSSPSLVQRIMSLNGGSFGTFQDTVPNSPGDILIQGSNTFAVMNIAAGRIVTFTNGTTQTVGNLIASGVANGYQYFPGVNLNYASTPDSAALSITGDIDIRVRCSADDWSPPVRRALAAKYATANGLHSYLFSLEVGGGLRLYLSANGTIDVNTDSITVVPFADGVTGWVRVTWRQSDGRVQFFTSASSSNDPSIPVWIQLGADRTIVVASINDNTSLLHLGEYEPTGVAPFLGRFYRVQIRNNILDNGTGVVFDADFTIKPLGANTFVESSVNAATVTINGVLAQAGDGRVIFRSFSSPSKWTISAAATSVTGVDVQDSTGTGAAAPIADSGGTDRGNNTGWAFNTSSVFTMAASLVLATSMLFQTKSNVLSDYPQGSARAVNVLDGRVFLPSVTEGRASVRVVNEASGSARPVGED